MINLKLTSDSVGLPTGGQSELIYYFRLLNLAFLWTVHFRRFRGSSEICFLVPKFVFCSSISSQPRFTRVYFAQTLFIIVCVFKIVPFSFPDYESALQLKKFSLIIFSLGIWVKIVRFHFPDYKRLLNYLNFIFRNSTIIGMPTTQSTTSTEKNFWVSGEIFIWQLLYSEKLHAHAI